MAENRTFLLCVDRVLMRSARLAKGNLGMPQKISCKPRIGAGMFLRLCVAGTVQGERSQIRRMNFSSNLNPDQVAVGSGI